ncbi:MAG: helix-turn-helix transcriptional regulator [Beijerinckiaceae bacterium]
MTFGDVMAALNVTRSELLELMENPAFPKPTKIGVSYDIVWNDADIAAFMAAQSRGLLG